MIEVFSAAGFEIQEADENSGSIFATTPLTFLTFGENIYISLEENQGNTTLEFNSATFWGMTSYGKNKKNYAWINNQRKCLKSSK